ncbi:hypothetical protein OFO94_29330, partial [Escherichia coli]|nr:hypothetical protein [Escherichia coli]
NTLTSRSLLIGVRVEAHHHRLKSKDKLFESSVCNAIHIFLRIIDYANKNVSRNLADEPAYLKDLIKHRSPAQGRQQHK